METVTTKKQLSDLVRMTERVGGNTQHGSVQEFSVVSSLKSEEFMKNLNSGNLKNKIYLEVAQLRLENIEWREWCDNGFLEGLRFNWTNGISTQKYAEGTRHGMKKSNMSKYQMLKKIKVEYTENIIVRIQMLDKFDDLIGQSLGSVDGKDACKVEEKVIEVNPGEIIVGVKIQEIPYHKDKGFPAGYDKREDRDYDETHIGSIQFQLMQLSQTPKNLITSTEISDFIISNKMLGGVNPFDGQNPISFTNDAKFLNQKDGCTGSWEIVESEETWMLEMNWDTDNVKGKFQFNNLKKEETKRQEKMSIINFNCVQASTNNKQLTDWKLNSLPLDFKFNKMTLLSHPNKAIIRDKRDKDFYQGHEVRWYRIGEESDACNFIFQALPNGKGKSQGEIIRLTEDIWHAMDCREGQYHKNNDVLSWRAHTGGNQWFVVNSDNSISPTHAPKMRWGLQDDGLLGLVDENLTDKILIFKEVLPSIDKQIATLPLIMSSPADGKAIILNGEDKQHGHGMEQFFKIGDSDKALKVFFDEGDFVRDSNYTFQAFDGYQHESRPLEYFTKHNDYSQQQFFLTVEGSIQFKPSPEYFLGLNETHEKVIFVKISDPNKCIFKNADKYSATNERVLETQKEGFVKDAGGEEE